jgi:c-di-GMP-binding flagellar brake protein YcgR
MQAIASIQGTAMGFLQDRSKERRREARTDITQPIKAQCLQTGRYLTGRTRNVSSAGALIEIDRPSLLVPGQRLALGIARTKQEVILAAAQLMPCTVVRSLGAGGTQRVAVQFDERQELAAAG